MAVSDDPRQPKIIVNRPFRTGYTFPSGVCVTKIEFQDQAPVDMAVTAYDRQLFPIYLRLLDAEAEGADRDEVIERLFGLCSSDDPARANRIYDSHLARAKWMSSQGFRELLRADQN